MSKVSERTLHAIETNENVTNEPMAGAGWLAGYTAIVKRNVHSIHWGALVAHREGTEARERAFSGLLAH